MLKWIGLAAAFAAFRAPAANSDAAAKPVVWKLGNRSLVGGYKTTVLGAPTTAAADRGLRFNGIGDGLVIPVDPIAGWPAFTIEALIIPAIGGGAEQRFLHVEDEHGNRALMEIRLRPDGQWCLDTFLLSEGHRLTLIDRSRLHPAGRPAWVTLRYDGHRMAHFVNGVEEQAGEVKISPFGPGRTSIGVRLNRVYWYKGVIREIRFEPTAVPAPDLKRLP